MGMADIQLCVNSLHLKGILDIKMICIKNNFLNLQLFSNYY